MTHVKMTYLKVSDICGISWQFFLSHIIYKSERFSDSERCDMEFHVVGKNIELTDAIKGHLDSKINKIFQDTDESTNVRISLCVEKHRHIADITVITNGVTLHAGDETEDLYTSIDSVLKKIDKHLKKHKARAQDIKIKRSFETKKELIANI